MRICLAAPNTLKYPDGGHIWVFLNWALGFRALGHEIVWLDVMNLPLTEAQFDAKLATLRSRLEPSGLQDSVVLCTADGKPLARERELPLLPVASVTACDLLCDHHYCLPHNLVTPFKRSIFVDIDPGQLQLALEMGTYDLAPHTMHFTIGEWTKYADRNPPVFPTRGVRWHYTSPPVMLDQWPVTVAKPGAAMTTVSDWFMANAWAPDEQGNWYDNSKRAAFEPYLDVARSSPVPLELCLNLGGYQEELERLRSLGWRAIDSAVTSDPNDYRRYLQNSLGEFSCAKPAYVRMHTGWLSDRTASYLASGKPVVVQKTGPSDFLDQGEGSLRFSTQDEAVQMLKRVHDDYPRHARAARQIAESHLDARKVLTRVLEIAM